LNTELIKNITHEHQTEHQKNNNNNMIEEYYSEEEEEEEEDLVTTHLETSHSTTTPKPVTITHQSIYTGLAPLFNNEQFSDCTVTFTNNKQTLHFHKIVLSMSSDFFSACFLGGMRESIEGTIELDDEEEMIPHVVTLLKSLYTGSIEVDDPDVLITLLQVVDKYQLKTLEPCLVEYLVKHVNPDTALQWKYFELDRNNPAYQKIFTKINSVLRSKRKNILSGNSLLSLEVEEYAQIIEVLTTKESTAMSLENVNRWIQKDEEKRAIFGRQLIEAMLIGPSRKFLTGHLVEFDPEYVSTKVQLSNDNSTLKKIAGTAYDCAALGTQTDRYKIKLGASCTHLMVGFATRNLQLEGQNYDSCGYYLYCNDGLLYGQDGKSGSTYSSAAYTPGTTIEAVYEDGYIGFIVNGQDCGPKAFCPLDEELYPAFGVHCNGCEFEFVDLD
jgi:hypothetical protein